MNKNLNNLLKNIIKEDDSNDKFPFKGVIITPENINKIEKRINSYIGVLLGSGSQGNAYEISNNKVLKITQDDSEARASNILLNHNHPNIVKFYDVFKFKNKHFRCYLYGIVMEKLKEITDPKLKKRLDDFYNFIPIYKSFGRGKTKYHKAIENIKELDEILPIDYTILNALKFLQTKGIFYSDLFIGNAMQDDKGNFKIIDLGLSRVAGGDKIDVLEDIRNNDVCIQIDELM